MLKNKSMFSVSEEVKYGGEYPQMCNKYFIRITSPNPSAIGFKKFRGFASPTVLTDAAALGSRMQEDQGFCAQHWAADCGDKKGGPFLEGD